MIKEKFDELRQKLEETNAELIQKNEEGKDARETTGDQSNKDDESNDEKIKELVQSYQQREKDLI